MQYTRFYETGDEVEIVKILDEERAEHLKKYIGKTGAIRSWIMLKGYRYKVKFSENEHYYFKQDEIKLVGIES